jgi:hypothetical protein
MPRASVAMDAKSNNYGGEVFNEVWFMRCRSQRTAQDHSRWKMLSLRSQTSSQEIDISLHKTIDARR